VLLMVAVQALVVGGVSLRLLTQRFVYPLDRLTGHAQGLAALRPLPALAWPPLDEFAPLARELDGLRQRVSELQTDCVPARRG
jgi:hypothetical protein